MNLRRFFLGGVLFYGVAWGQPLEIDEALIQKLAQAENPSQQNIEASYLQASYGRQAYAERFNTSLVASGQYTDSSEKAIASFIPIFAPATEIAVGVERPFRYGVNTSLEAFTSQSSTSDSLIDRATRTGVRAELSFDLWKNIGGRLDRAELKGREITQKKAKLQAKLDQRALELNLRKIYWSLVANSESLRVSTALLEVANQQLKEAKRRLRASVTDKGVVARYQAQVASREARLASLNYQRRNLIESLQRHLPELVGKEVVLKKYSVEEKVTEVLLCTDQIRGHKEVPWKFTDYDELIDLINQGYQQDRIITSAHSSVDLQLNSQLQVSGVDQGYGNSFQDFSNNGKLGYSVGLALKVPLGGGPSTTEATQRAVDKMRANAEKDQLRLQVKSKHQQIGKIIDYLYTSLKKLEVNTKSLATSVKEMERKYKQARVSAFDLINEQDVLHSSQLAEIDTKLNVIHILYEYFQVFPDFPCKSNRLEVQS